MLKELLIQPHFKQTEIGEIPEDWNLHRLPEVAEYQNGRAFPSDDYCSDGVLLVRPGNLAANGRVVWDDKHTTYLPTRYWVDFPEYRVGAREILMNLTAQSLEDEFLGRVCLTPEDNQCLLNQRIARITPKDVEPDFLFWLLKGSHFRKYVDLIPQGSKVQHLYNRDLDNVQLAVPSERNEQRKIAAILSSVEEAITSTQAVIDQTRKVKQGVLQQLLTRGIGHTRFKESAIGKIPEVWELKSAEQLCTRIAVGIVIKPTQYYVKSGIPCFRSANVQEGYVQDRDWVYISEESNRLLEKSKLKAGDVLVVRTGYPGTSCVVPEKFDGTNCIDIIFARPDKNLISPEYLSWFINSSLGKKQVLQTQGGLAQQHFNVGSLNCMQISVPPLEEQKRIVDILYSIQSTISQAEVELENLSNLKRGLMQDLLTGKVRVGCTS